MKKFVWLGLGGVSIVLIWFVWFVLTPESTPASQNQPIEISGDPMDATADFFDRWHDAALSTSTDPRQAGLLEHPRLTPAVQSYLSNATADTDRVLDPVFCQSEIPPRIGTKLSFQLDAEAEVHVLARGQAERSTSFTVVKLTGRDGEWAISEIRCSTGETGPVGEFSFEREGFLLKSVPPPLNPDYWHLVFEENGVNGHTAPLFFTASSTCIAIDGTETTCDPSTFTDATKVLVQGEMTEAGVDVTRLIYRPK